MSEEQELGCKWTKAKITLQGTGPSEKPVMLGFDFKAIDKAFADLVLAAAVQLVNRQRAEYKQTEQRRLA